METFEDSMAAGLIRSILPLHKIIWYTRQQIEHFCWIWKLFIESIRDGEVEGMYLESQ